MDHRRRRLLKLGSIVAAGGLAGCSSGSESTPSDGGGDATPTPTSGSATGSDSGPGTTAGGDGGGQFDFGGWFDDVSYFEGTVDMTGQSEVTVDVGAAANDNLSFGPPAVQVDPGTAVTWEWTGEGGAHNVVSQSGADFRSGDPTSAAGTTFSQPFDSAGIVTYYCNPHSSLGMKGAVVVGDPGGGTGTRTGNGTGSATGAAYGFGPATFDAYWYSLYNMSTNIAMSGNGVLFPHTEEQRQQFRQRLRGMVQHADVDGPPIANPNLNMAPFTEGDPHFTEQPVFENDAGKPDASTLMWDRSASSRVVSPAALAWTHLKGVTWAKNFENHFEVLPTQAIAPKFRAQMLSTLAQLGTNFSLVQGNLRANEDNLLLVGEFRPGEGVVTRGPRLRDHAAMLWFLSDLVSLATGGWFGYENPEPLIPAENVQMLADGMAQTTMNAFAPEAVLDAGTTRDVGELLGAVGWYGTHAGSDDLRSSAADYANALAGVVADATDGNGRVGDGADNQAATQGIVAQGLLWASQIEGVDHADAAADVTGYLFDELWDPDAGTFASGTDASTYTITARDAGDVTGGVNAADAVLGRSDARSVFARFFNQTFNRGRLQRAERPPSHSEDQEFPLPLPPAAGGEYGQAAVYNSEVEYDAEADEWSVTDDRFRTADALYLANQDIWVGNWAGDFFQGRGVPGESDSPE